MDLSDRPGTKAPPTQDFSGPDDRLHNQILLRVQSIYGITLFSLIDRYVFILIWHFKFEQM